MNQILMTTAKNNSNEQSLQKVHVDAGTYVVCDRCHRRLDRVFIKGENSKPYGIDCKDKVAGEIVVSYEMVWPDGRSEEGLAE